MKITEIENILFSFKNSFYWNLNITYIIIMSVFMFYLINAMPCNANKVLLLFTWVYMYVFCTVCTCYRMLVIFKSLIVLCMIIHKTVWYLNFLHYINQIILWQWFIKWRLSFLKKSNYHISIKILMFWSPCQCIVRVAFKS